MNAIYEQFRRPSGPLGWVVGQAMALKNTSRSQWVLQLLAAKPGEQILEVGFGSGVDVARILRGVAPGGKVMGIDLSDVMVRMARRRNRRAVTEGRAVLTEASVEDLPFADDQFDAVYSVNCAQFWPDLQAALAGLYRVTRTGGRAVIAVQPRHRGATAADSQRWRDKLERAAQAAGWRSIARELGPQRIAVAAVVLEKNH